MGISNRRMSAARKLFSDLSESLKGRDLDDIFQQASAKFNQLQGQVPAALVAIWDDMGTLVQMLACNLTGRYREVPWRTLAAIAAALLYFVMPLDAVPDFIPLGGYLDDAFVFKLVFDLVASDIQEFKRWRDGGIIIEHEQID